MEHHHYNFLHEHAGIILLSWYFFSAMVSGMPTPLPEERWYQWAYVTLHALAGSIARGAASIYPQAFPSRKEEPPKNP